MPLGNVATVSLNNTDISIYCKSISPKVSRDKKKMARLGGNQTTNLPGTVDVSFALEGWTDAVVIDLIAPLALAANPAAVPLVVVLDTGMQFSAAVRVSNFQPKADSEDPQSWTCDLEPDENGVTYA